LAFLGKKILHNFLQHKKDGVFEKLNAFYKKIQKSTPFIFPKSVYSLLHFPLNLREKKKRLKNYDVFVFVSFLMVCVQNSEIRK